MGNTEPRSLEADLGNTGIRRDSAAGVGEQARPPRVVAVEPLHDHSLRVSFENGIVKLYDVKPLLQTPLFRPLEDPAVFRTAHVEPGGFAVAWGSTIDISEYELWEHGS